MDGIDVKSYFLTALIPDKGFKKTIYKYLNCVYGELPVKLRTICEVLI